MKLHLAMAVWGDWHFDMLERVTLPSLLSPANLPNVLGRLDTVVTIFTRRSDIERLQGMTDIHALSSLAPIEIVAPPAWDPKSTIQHMRFWAQCLAAAREQERILVFLHPDFVWADGAFTRIVAAMERGKSAALMPPNLRVASETFVPDAVARYGRAMTIPPRELIELSVRHLHPLSAMAMPDLPAWIPTPDRIWGVHGAGLIIRMGYQTVLALDPARCELNGRFLITNIAELDGIHAPVSEDDGMSVSLAPLLKDHGMALGDGGGKPVDLGRWPINSGCDVPLNREMIRYAARLAYADAPPAAWDRAMRRTRAFMIRVEITRRAARLWSALKARGHVRLCQILALAMHNVDLARRARGPAPLTLILPSEAALAALPKPQLHALMAAGNEKPLGEYIANNVVRATPADKATHIVDRFTIDDTTILIADRVAGL